jgi:hypothetical protein
MRSAGLRSRLRLGACAIVIALGTSVPAQAGATGKAATPPWLGDVPGTANVAPDPTPPHPPIALADCTVTNPLFAEDRARVRSYVPGHYRLGRNAFLGESVATVMVGVVACQQIRVDGHTPVRGVLAVVAVQVETDRATGYPGDPAWNLYTRSTANVLTASSWYLIDAQTDNSALAQRLKRSGLSIDYAPGLNYSLVPDALTVPLRDGALRLVTATEFPDSFVHNHDWTFWQDNRRGSQSGFLLHLHGLSDDSCGYWTSPAVQLAQHCGSFLSLPPGSALAALFGGTSCQTPYAFNHPQSHAPGYLLMRRDQA